MAEKQPSWIERYGITLLTALGMLVSLAYSHGVLSQRVSVNEQAIAELKQRSDKTEAALSDVQRKLDVMTTLLQRIDSKLGHP